MGRSSKGNTGNESRNLYKWLKDASEGSNRTIDRKLRSPAMPSSFAEASLLARKAQEKRDRSFMHSSGALVIFDDLPRPASLSESSCSEISAADHPTPASLELTMEPVDAGDEADLSVSILNMKLDVHTTQREDSFSSQPDSDFNMGAVKFLELLESALEHRASQDQAVQFEELVIQMLDLSMDNKLSTPYDIVVY